MASVWMRACWLLVLSNILVTANAKEVLIGGSGTDIATMRIMAQSFTAHYPDIEIKVLPSLGSGGGIKAVARGSLHIGISSRALKPKEHKYPVSGHLYARTALVFATQQSNSADAIRSDIIFDVMSGKKHYWPGGELIRLVLRPPTDSDTLLLKQNYVQLDQALAKAYQTRGIPVARTDQDAAKALETIKGSLGTSTLALIMGEGRALKALTLDDVAPTTENLANGSYAMSKELYLVLPEKPDADALKFVHFVNSAQGAQILKETGHLPLPFTLY